MINYKVTIDDLQKASGTEDVTAQAILKVGLAISERLEAMIAAINNAAEAGVAQRR
ncbi:MAG TPA: hypothetical protein VKM54_13835 [Myxococcota bacterium]|nr:hypothetical protein [Myxococcota bacterium]